MDTFWNLEFSQLLRNTQQYYWGNWTLDAQIQPGAVGTVDLSTGSFQFLDTLPNATTDTVLPASNEWVVQSDTVKQKTADGSISGGGVDPDSGTEGSGQLTVQWEFSEVGSISSTFTVVEQAQLHDYGNQIVANLPWLVSEANSVGMASDGEISQGFGVVTSVLLASCGLNLGSEIKSSTFAISGSADASNAMAGNAKGAVAGSYSQTGQTASFEQHLWPATSGGPATTNVPIAFQFASFINGNQLIVGWITDVSDIEIELDDDHGGTYIVDAKASYTSGGQSQSVSASVSGGRTTTMPPIPTDATDLVVALSFKDGGDHRFSWPTPLGTFPDGQIAIDLYGAWPGKTKAKERHTRQLG
jgi:hypothetical protein